MEWRSSGLEGDANLDANVEDAVVTERARVERWLRRRHDATASDAADAVSTAVVCLWNKRGTLRSTKRPAIRKWLQQASYYALLDERLHGMSSATRPVEDWADTLISPAKGPWDESEMEISLARSRWHRALERIPRSRRAILLRRHAGESFAGIASELKVPNTQLRVKAHRDYRHSIEIARQLPDEPIYTRFVLSSSRVARIAEIAGVVPRCVRHLVLECDWSNPEEHQAWLDLASDEEIAHWVMEQLANLEGTDDLD